jgi:hypothetical protein
VPVTTLQVWRIPPSAVPRALWAMAVDRGRLRRTPGVRFVKLLGTGRGSSFGPTSADLTRWAAFTVTEGPPPVAGTRAVARCTLTLDPIASRGTWARRTPFEQPRLEKPQPTGAGTGTVLVLTRARLRASRAPVFWRTIAPVAKTLDGQEGLLATFGVGEAPLGFQGTVSIWRDAADIVRFAYRQPEHAAVVASTPHQRWYAEELFARFHVLRIDGDREVIGWKEAL